MSTKDFLSVTDVSPVELQQIIAAARNLKKDRWNNLMEKKILILMFEKPSTRTRVSFDAGMREMGGQCIYLSPDEVGLGKRESARDVALVLSRYASVIAARTFLHSTIEELASYATVPVINALSDLEHPCQALADIMTIAEHKGELKGLTLAYAGDGNNTIQSLMIGCAMSGINCRIATPAGYEIDAGILAKAQDYAEESGATVMCGNDPQEAVTGADVIYADVWTSMGQEAEAATRRQVFAPYRVTEQLLYRAKPDAIFMHPLPAHHGEEVAEGIIYQPRCVVFDEAENRLHAQKALLAWKLGKL